MMVLVAVGFHELELKSPCVLQGTKPLREQPACISVSGIPDRLLSLLRLPVRSSRRSRPVCGHACQRQRYSELKGHAPPSANDGRQVVLHPLAQATHHGYLYSCQFEAFHHWTRTTSTEAHLSKTLKNRSDS